jgi:hypothetical protein
MRDLAADLAGVGLARRALVDLVRALALPRAPGPKHPRRTGFGSGGASIVFVADCSATHALLVVVELDAVSSILLLARGDRLAIETFLAS